MNTLDRRQFLALAGAAALISGAPSIVRAAGAPRIVIVGGGLGGATAAKYLKLWGGSSVAVTLIDAKPKHTACILSNLVVTGMMGLKPITFDLAALASRYGIELITDTVTAIDAAGHVVERANGAPLAYDRVVLSPGVQFDPVPGLDSNKVPHAWIAGPQTLMLRRQLQRMPAGGTFVMTIPPKPYRCPPGPYERACVVADFLQSRAARAGRKTAATPKVIVLDANPEIVAEKETFTEAFNVRYAGIVEYHPNAQLLSVDSAQRIAFTSVGDFDADVLNVIPTHRAGSIVPAGALTADGRWAAVDPLSYEVPAVPGVHVIGDSQGTGQPKSGHMANAEAKTCADAILRLIAGNPVDGAERIANLRTNSACYSPITHSIASWLTAVYAYNTGTKTMDVVTDSFAEAPEPTAENFEMMFAWSSNLFADTFK